MLHGSPLPITTFTDVATTLKMRGPLLAGEGGKTDWIATARRLQSAGVTQLNIGPPPDLAPGQGPQRVIAPRKVLTDAR